MLTLAIEQSTAFSSVALLSDETLLRETSWTETRARQQHLFSVLPEFFNATSVKPDSIDAFAVGLGPGSFSGLRVSLSAARALALPGDRPVLGVASAEALAWRLSVEKEAPSIVILGDARRRRLWFVQFEASGDGLRMAKPFSLVKLKETADLVDKGTIVATPDWDRIGADLQASVSSEVTLIRERVVPTARSVGLLSLRSPNVKQVSDPTDPISPIYLHPPVFVKPRFAQSK